MIASPAARSPGRPSHQRRRASACTARGPGSSPGAVGRAADRPESRPPATGLGQPTADARRTRPSCVYVRWQSPTRPVRERRRRRRRRRLVVRHPQRVAGEALIFGQLRPPQHLGAQRGPLAFVLQAEEDAVPVAGGVRTVRGDRRPCTWSTTPTRTSVDFESPAGVSRRRTSPARSAAAPAICSPPRRRSPGCERMDRQPNPACPLPRIAAEPGERDPQPRQPVSSIGKPWRARRRRQGQALTGWPPAGPDPDASTTPAQQPTGNRAKQCQRPRLRPLTGPTPSWMTQKGARSVHPDLDCSRMGARVRSRRVRRSAARLPRRQR
jgi:hypothetical protein